jgi:uncharacterized protein Veg
MADRLNQLEALEKIKEGLLSLLGSPMRFRTNLGRCRILERVGVLEAVHPNLFVIRVDEPDKTRRISYTYVDVLTKTVELSHPQSNENLFPWLN